MKCYTGLKWAITFMTKISIILRHSTDLCSKLIDRFLCDQRIGLKWGKGTNSPVRHLIRVGFLVTKRITQKWEAFDAIAFYAKLLIQHLSVLSRLLVLEYM